jgi:hypothetical protein
VTEDFRDFLAAKPLNGRATLNRSTGGDIHNARCSIFHQFSEIGQRLRIGVLAYKKHRD